MGEFIAQPTFAAGEIGPELYGRIDLDLYELALRTCENFVVRQYGGISNRPGTKLTAETKDSTRKTRLIPFQFNEEQTYALEFGHLTLRIIKDGAEVLEAAKNITGITQANPGVVTIAGHGYSNGDDLYLTGIVGMEELNGRGVRVANQTANTFELQDYQGNNINTSGYAAYASGGTAARIYTVATPFEEADLFDLNYAQSNDVLTVVHKDYYPRDITRTAHTAWTIANFDNKEGPFKTVNSTTTTLIASAATGSGVTLTASASLFDSTWVGELIYIEQMPNDTTPRWEVNKAVVSGDVRRSGSHYYEAKNSATTGTWRPDHTEGTATDGDGAVTWEYLHSGFGIAKVTAYTDATHVTVTIIKRLPSVVTSTATDIWARAAWSDTEGYPQACAYHKQRMWFGGTQKQPQGIWASTVGARTQFSKSNPILDDDAITILLDTVKVNVVRHLVPMTRLVSMTSGSEQVVNGPNDLILATDTISANPQSYTGCSRVVPLVIEQNILFVQDMGNLVRSIAASNEAEGYVGINLSARSPHLFRKKQIVQWDYHREPLSVVWCVRNDGVLLGFTYMEEQKVYAWSRHITDGLFESVCCIREGDETATYVVVKRTIGGQTRRFVERMESRYFEDIVDAYFVDCGLTYDGRNTAATTMTITGGTTWDSPEVLTLTASTSTFKATDVGNQIVFFFEEDETEIAVRLTISAYTSGTVVSVVPSRQVPVAYRSTAFTDWRFAKTTFLPLNHLEGEAVAVLADGNVVEGLSVASGKVTLPEPAAVVHIGLPYRARAETLDIVRANRAGSRKAKPINIPRVFIDAQETRGIFVGINGFENVREYKQRLPSTGYDAPIPAETDLFEIVTNSAWSRRGRVCIEQNLPLPITVNAIIPDVADGFN